MREKRPVWKSDGRDSGALEQQKAGRSMSVWTAIAVYLCGMAAGYIIGISKRR